MNILSLFDGLGGARIALDQLGIACTYYASEIDKYAIQVHQANYPDTIQLGSVLDLKGTDLPKIDLLIGGSPCQDLSVAKVDREGLAGEKSMLFYEYVRLLEEAKPRYFLLENVASMDKKSRHIITKLLGVQPILINSALVTAQHRERWYWTNIPHGFKLPKDLNIALKDILESKESEGCSYNFSKNLHHIGKNKASTLTARYGKGFSNFDNQTAVISKPNVLNQYQESGVQTSLQNRVMDIQGKSLALSNFVPKVPKKVGQIGNGGNAERIYDITAKSPALLSSYKTNKGEFYQIENENIRKLSPLECERLQGIPDNYTACVSNSQRYKMIGNGFTVPVIKHLLSFMKV